MLLLQNLHHLYCRVDFLNHLCDHMTVATEKLLFDAQHCNMTALGIVDQALQGRPGSIVKNLTHATPTFLAVTSAE